MIRSIFWADRLKLRRTSLPAVLVLVPLLVLAYELVNLTYRADYVVRQAALFKAQSMWEFLLYDNSLLYGLGFPLAATIVTSMIVNIEHQSNSWKAILAQPVSKVGIYMSEFAWTILGLTFSASIFFVGTILLGKGLGFEGKMPLWLIFADSYSILITTLPMIAFQCWLSIVFKNQAFPIIVGAILSIMGLFFAAGSTTRWLPLAYPVQSSTVTLQYEGLGYNGDLPAYITINILLGIVLLVIGMIDFRRREM